MISILEGREGTLEITYYDPEQCISYNASKEAYFNTQWLMLQVSGQGLILYVPPGQLIRFLRRDVSSLI